MIAFMLNLFEKIWNTPPINLLISVLASVVCLYIIYVGFVMTFAMIVTRGSLQRLDSYLDNYRM